MTAVTPASAPTVVDPRDLRMPVWVIVWLTISAIIQTYDACYVLLGPLSHDGGPLAGLWPGHVFYGSFDQRYSQFDAFGSAQSWANLLEVIVDRVGPRPREALVGCRRRPDRDRRDVLEDRDLLPGGDLQRPRDDASVARAG